jgi:hypothetical protein
MKTLNRKENVLFYIKRFTIQLVKSNKLSNNRKGYSEDQVMIVQSTVTLHSYD